MLQWYANLDPAQQAALQGLLVMAIFAIVRAIAAWSGKPLNDSAAAKLGNYLTVAAATAFATLLTTGAVPAFWWQWALALFTAVGSWEGISKLYKPIRENVENAALGSMPLGLIIVVVLAITPALADRAPIEASPIASLDGGPAFGACLSYPVMEVGDYTGWLDGGTKKAGGGNNLFFGGSTDAWRIIDEIPILKIVFPVLDFALPSNARVGGGYLFANKEWMFYMRVPLLEF